MSVDRKLLEILVCPISKQPLEILNEKRLKLLNDGIESGELHRNNDEVISESVNEALITRNGETIYVIDDGIPVMLEDLSIPTVQIQGWS